MGPREPLDPEEVDEELHNHPNDVPDPYHDTRGVHGDTGEPVERLPDPPKEGE